MSIDGSAWFILNASPDLRGQIAATPSLHAKEIRSSPIHGVVLTGAEVDTIAGLLTLRERQPFRLFATSAVLAILDANPVFEVLDRATVARVAVTLDTPFDLAPGLRCTLFTVPGKAPLFLETDFPAIVEDDTTVGAALDHEGRRLFFVPGCARMTDRLADRLRGAECVLFDGTLFTDDEMIRAGIGTKTGLRMGHMSMIDTIPALAGLDIARKVFVHINNSNPVLMEDSPEHAAVRAAGWDVAFDGMELP